MFSAGDSYERFMGRWSRAVARLLVPFAGVRDGESILDVGCGTGALTDALATWAPTSHIVAIDRAEPFIAAAQATHSDPRIRFEIGDAQQLPFDDASFDRTLSLFILNFVPDAARAVGEMLRVTRPSGTVTCAVWDYSDGMQMLRMFWEDAVALDRTAASRDERRMPLSRRGELGSLFRAVSFAAVDEAPLTIRCRLLHLTTTGPPFSKCRDLLACMPPRSTPVRGNSCGCSCGSASSAMAPTGHSCSMHGHGRSAAEKINGRCERTRGSARDSARHTCECCGFVAIRRGTRFAVVWGMRMLAYASLAIVITTTAAISGAGRQLTAIERLGKALFFDTSLSARGNQSCGSCHEPNAGWTGGQEDVNKGGAVYEGSISGRFGNRKPPSAAYATAVPNFRLVGAHRSVFTEFSGGNFWDGRATGAKLGNAAADQAQGPFLNPLEHALPDAETVVSKVCTGAEAGLFKQVWGTRACLDPGAAFASIARSIAAYEASSEVNQFSSKWDAVLAGRAKLTPQELHGLDLFTGKAHCSSCHPNRSVNGAPLFTNFAFENLGVPRNPANPFYDNSEANPDGPRWIDRGLGGFLENTPALAQYAAAQSGKHRVPTLRNVDLRPSPAFVKAYGHNGYFKSLKSLVHFYNTRDALPACDRPSQVEGVDCWPKPEVPANMTTVSVGDLGLTDADEDAIVAFLATLSDGFTHR